MKGDLFLDGKMFISSERAAKIGGYTKDYVGQLCRGGKLESKMVGRTWYVGLDSLIKHKNLNPEGKFWRRTKNHQKSNLQQTDSVIISVTDFTAKKIEDLKITKKSTPPDSYSSELYSGNQTGTVPTTSEEIFEGKNFFNEQDLNIKSEKEIQISYPLFSVTNKAVDRDKNYIGIDIHKKTKQKKSLFIFNPHFTYGIALAFAFSASVFFGIMTVKVSPYSQAFYGEKITAIERRIDLAVDKTSSDFSQLASAYSTRQSFDKFAISFYRSVRDFIKGSRLRVLVWLSGDSLAVVPDSSYVGTSKQEGLVVVPKKDNENYEQTVTRIKKTFSDEVSVSPDESGTSGVITPVFRSAEGEDYLYVLVPIQDE